jgi:uncharacterized protein (TIGR03663 family)
VSDDASRSNASEAYQSQPPPSQGWRRWSPLVSCPMERDAVVAPGETTDQRSKDGSELQLSQSFTMTDRVYWTTAAAIVLLSSVVHLWKLGLRPLAHDEAIDAWFSWQARTGDIIRYDPVYHGPLRFYLEGPILGVFGVTAGWARTIAAVAGVVATAVIAGSRQVVGSVGALVAALLFTVSPTVLTVTRTGREDSLVGLVSLAVLLLVAHLLVAPRPRHVVAGGVLLAVSFGLKETTFIFGFAGACFFVGLGVVAIVRPDGGARRFWGQLAALGRAPWLWAIAAFIVVFAFIFTSAFRYPEGFESGITDGIRYWWGQHDVGRGGQRWFFYFSILSAYEWLVVAVAGAGIASSIRRRSLVGAWFGVMAVVQLAVYSWAGEKFAWLALHPTIPMVLLAGLGAQEIALSASTVRARVVVGGALALAAIGTVAIAVRPAITDGADPSELLVTVQTSTDVHEISAHLAAAQRAGAISSILVDGRDSGSWPWAWYLHELDDVTFVELDPAGPLPSGYDAYIVSASTPPPAVPAGYSIERFPLREWWLPDYESAGVADLASWWLTRRTWNPTGSSDQYLIIREAAAR